MIATHSLVEGADETGILGQHRLQRVPPAHRLRHQGGQQRKQKSVRDLQSHHLLAHTPLPRGILEESEEVLGITRSCARLPTLEMRVRPLCARVGRGRGTDSGDKGDVHPALSQQQPFPLRHMRPPHQGPSGVYHVGLGLGAATPTRLLSIEVLEKGQDAGPQAALDKVLQVLPSVRHNLLWGTLFEDHHLRGKGQSRCSEV